MSDPLSRTTMTGRLSRPELEAWGDGVGRAAVADGALPLVLALRGALGAGKSVLARAVARGVGVTSPMPSPTYNLMFTYEGGGVAVHHLDLYRLDDPDDVWELGWEDLGVGRQVVLIEWPERAEALLPPDRWDVTMEFTDGELSDGEGEDAGGPDPTVDGVRRLTATRNGKAPDLPPLTVGGP